MSERILADRLSTLPDRRTAERRVEQDDMPNGHQERSGTERRISPAIGENAIQQCERLRESNKELLHALEMVRDANCDDPHIPPSALACINAAIAKAQP